jgi:hypothetical protein
VDVDTRRKLEVEGFGRDIESVKRKIKLYDEYMSRLKKLVQENPSEVIGNFILSFVHEI